MACVGWITSLECVVEDSTDMNMRVVEDSTDMKMCVVEDSTGMKMCMVEDSTVVSGVCFAFFFWCQMVVADDNSFFWF